MDRSWIQSHTITTYQNRTIVYVANISLIFMVNLGKNGKNIGKYTIPYMLCENFRWHIGWSSLGQWRSVGQLQVMMAVRLSQALVHHATTWREWYLDLFVSEVFQQPHVDIRTCFWSVHEVFICCCVTVYFMRVMGGSKTFAWNCYRICALVWQRWLHGLPQQQEINYWKGVTKPKTSQSEWISLLPGNSTTGTWWFPNKISLGKARIFRDLCQISGV